jgi:hypothetical protein
MGGAAMITCISTAWKTKNPPERSQQADLKVETRDW